MRADSICHAATLDEGNARRRLEDIAEAEGVPLAEGAVDALIRWVYIHLISAGSYPFLQMSMHMSSTCYSLTCHYL